MKNRTNLSIIFFLCFLFLITLASCKYNIKVPDDPPSYPTGYITNIKVWEIRELAYDKKFKTLNELLGKYQSEFEKNYEKELEADVAFRSFEIPDPKLKDPLMEWIRKYPDRISKRWSFCHCHRPFAFVKQPPGDL